jgi:hypothetical protein
MWDRDHALQLIPVLNFDQDFQQSRVKVVLKNVLLFLPTFLVLSILFINRLRSLSIVLNCKVQIFSQEKVREGFFDRKVSTLRL